MIDFPSAISAGSALVAVVVSLLLLRQGQEDRRELRRERERRQAAQVSFWADWTDPLCPTLASPAQVPAIWVANSSDAVVYDVFIDYRSPGRDRIVRHPIGPVPPGETHVIEVECKGELHELWEPGAVLPQLFFQDSAGKRWVRGTHKGLREDHNWGNEHHYHPDLIPMHGFRRRLYRGGQAADEAT